MTGTMKQKSFSSLAYEQKKKKTKRECFLEEMDAVIPWQEFVQVIEPYYPKPQGAGRRPIGLEVKLRIYFMQQWYNLSDPAMEDALYDIESMRRFAGLDLETDAMPDESTICKFRHLLEIHGLSTALFDTSTDYLKEHDLFINQGTIVDASIINASSSTKNKQRKRDPEMRQTKKGNQWYFGMKVHIGADADSRLVHSAEFSSANVHDSQMFDQLVHGEEQAVYGDKAYDNANKAADYQAQGIRWRVARKSKRGQKPRPIDKIWNRHQSRTRCKVEHVFNVIKNLWGHSKARYKGLAKNQAHFMTLLGLANLYLARRELATSQE